MQSFVQFGLPCPYCAEEPTTHKPAKCKMRPYKATSGSATPEEYPPLSEAGKGKPKGAKGPKGATVPKVPGILDHGAASVITGPWADAEDDAEDDGAQDGSARSSADPPK